MSDGNKFDVTANAQQRQQNRLPFEEMGNVLLDAMQGTLICLDSNHIIVDVSKTVKRYFGFENTELIGLPILLLIEDSERDSFLKFLNNPPQPNDVCYVRMMMNNTNEYHQVKIYRKKKRNQDNVDVHSTTPRHSCSVGTILIITLEDSSYIDISLHDIFKQEFYTKMNLIGEIIFEDHRGALITGYLPHEILSQSIFNFVNHEDRVVKLHALWKCVTTGSSKLQWRFNARDGSVVFLQTEYKLISDHQNHEIIIARNEVLGPVQRSQFDELQTAWRHQCAADIKGNSSSFKHLSSSDTDLSSIPNGECRICVPALNMCFTTNKLQPLNLQGNIFDGSKSTRPLTIQDYISILIDNDKHMDSELTNMINNIQSFTARYRRLNDNTDKNQEDMTSDVTIDEKFQSESSPLSDASLRRKQESDSIVRGILNSSIKYNHDKQAGDSSSTLVRFFNGNGNNSPNGNPRLTVTATAAATSQVQINQPKSNSTPLSPEAFHQQHIDFIKKYKAAKAKLESQLELVRSQEAANGGQPSDISKRNVILNKLSQLENIKNKQLARRHELKRQTITTTAVPVNNIEQKDFLNSLFSSSEPNSMTLLPTDHMNNPLPPPPPLSLPSTSVPSPLSSLFSSPNDQSISFFQHQRSSSQQFDPGQNQLYDDFLTPPPSSYIPVNNNPSTSVHSYMNLSYQPLTNDSTSTSSFPNLHHNTSDPF